MLLLIFEQTFTGGVLYDWGGGGGGWGGGGGGGGGAEAVRKMISYPRLICLLPWFAAPVGASHWLF